MRYSSLPITIEAFRFEWHKDKEGSLESTIQDLEHWLEKRDLTPNWRRADHELDGRDKIFGKQGWAILKYGDYIIEEPDGSGIYPCNPKVFEYKYTADEPQHSDWVCDTTWTPSWVHQDSYTNGVAPDSSMAYRFRAAKEKVIATRTKESHKPVPIHDGRYTNGVSPDDPHFRTVENSDSFLAFVPDESAIEEELNRD